MRSSADRRKTSFPQRLIDAANIKATLNRNRLLWVAPTVFFGVMGFLHVVTQENQWRATQTLIVQNEAIGEVGFSDNMPPGRFEGNEALKRFRKTLLQVSKHREVLRATLEQVGPPTQNQQGRFPLERDIDAFRKAVAVAAPHGSDVGTSEIIYLSVIAYERQRAIQLTKVMSGELEKRMRTIRNEYAQSRISELQEKESLAKCDLERSMRDLSELECAMGEDLGEIRALADGDGGGSILQTQLNQIEGELHQAEYEQATEKELLAFLEKSSNNPEAILAIPNRLLEWQPGLRRLKDGLADARLRTARIGGGLPEAHPRVQSALQNERNLEQQLLHEVDTAVHAIRAEIGLDDRLKASLREKLQKVQQRLDALASQRAPYGSLTAEVNQRREQLRLASASLAEARVRQEVLNTSSLITRVDQPVTGANPEGPGSTVLLIGSMAAGLAVGLSLVYLVAPWQEASRGRRITDHVGRRATVGRKVSDSGDRRPASTTTEAESSKSSAIAWESEGDSAETTTAAASSSG